MGFRHTEDGGVMGATLAVGVRDLDMQLPVVETVLADDSAAAPVLAIVDLPPFAAVHALASALSQVA